MGCFHLTVKENTLRQNNVMFGKKDSLYKICKFYRNVPRTCTTPAVYIAAHETGRVHASCQKKSFSSNKKLLRVLDDHYQTNCNRIFLIAILSRMVCLTT